MLMGTYMREIGETINLTGRENTSIRMEQSILENG
jgi:hypothetical protein